MPETTEKFVTRDHLIKKTLIAPRQVEGEGSLVVFSCREYYNEEEVAKWCEDEHDRRVTKCRRRDCRVYTIAADLSPTQCLECLKDINDGEIRDKMNRLYVKKFPSRLVAFAKDLRKVFPEYSVRKGRKQNIVRFEEMSVGKLPEVERIALSHNLKVDRENIKPWCTSFSEVWLEDANPLMREVFHSRSDKVERKARWEERRKQQ